MSRGYIVYHDHVFGLFAREWGQSENCRLIELHRAPWHSELLFQIDESLSWPEV